MAMFPGRKRAKSEAQRISWLFDFLTRSGYFLKGKQSRSYQKSYTSFTILLCNVVNINWANKNKYSLLLLLLSHYVVSNSASPWTTAQHAPQYSISQSLLKFMSTDSVMLPNHLILCSLPSTPSCSRTASCLAARVPSLASWPPQPWVLGAGQGLPAVSFLPFLGRKPGW